MRDPLHCEITQAEFIDDSDNCRFWREESPADLFRRRLRLSLEKRENCITEVGVDWSF
jgi:hypothetical protein